MTPHGCRLVIASTASHVGLVHQRAVRLVARDDAEVTGITRQGEDDGGGRSDMMKNWRQCEGRSRNSFTAALAE